ncbi:unnamed protein product [marine sediment metagenome]|uniref:Uncharacterized protein n=1 Tax=marine sediment metagenome TaxID=412755 RepID=X1DLA8_9ZZZZ
MAKVKVCLNTGCTKYILLDDGRCVETPLGKCAPTVWGDKENSQWNSIVQQTTQAIKVNMPVLQDVKVGDDIKL